ncbi:MAG: NTP transferase domain-containing protein [Melioribacteraceae bacterium]|nr:NTP transferase domain-containing protein [Melioribacteraceae bacterium]MCF8263128.1 NTP transferase domain-containing protein [Melioribacteraceae bacterium]MCF8430540.1 NTP transferase domain-containing protein [Melioribacteraceae bacterium]
MKINLEPEAKLLIILAGGMSSRMRKKTDGISNLDKKLLLESESKAKCMISVGKDGRPFLDYLLFNVFTAGFTHVLMVVNQKDKSIINHYDLKDGWENLNNLKIAYTVQTIPDKRTKPMGTADALLQALDALSELKGKSFAVCNSDNLYSSGAFSLILNSNFDNAMLDYDMDKLEFSIERIASFAITKKDEDGFLNEIVEKPSSELIEKIREKDGYVGVSMNIFKFNYDQVLEYLINAPINVDRDEKELPAVVQNMINENPKSLFAIPFSEHILDLTGKSDIKIVQKYLNENFESIDFNQK